MHERVERDPASPPSRTPRRSIRAIESVFGSQFADVLAGSPRTEQLMGLAGDDQITGGSGSELLAGGPATTTSTPATARPTASTAAAKQQVGAGPDVLLIGGLGDTVESWQFQLDGLADRYRVTAFDNRGAGRTPMPTAGATVEAMADDAAAVLRALAIPSAHVAGFSGGSVIAQELALRHPGLVRSLVLQSTWAAPDRYLRAWMRFVHWLVEVAPSERALFEAFFLDIYTARAHNDGTVDAIVDEVLAFPHKQATEDIQRFLDALIDHDTTDRLPRITAPTLVLAGGRDSTSRPELCRTVAELIPGARFEVLEAECHQPFQEVPDAWNSRVHAFWHEVEQADA